MPNIIYLPELLPLYTDMKKQNEGRAKFIYRHGRVTFDVIFFIDEVPFSLLFGAKQYNLAFEFEVVKGFAVECNLARETYKALCDALGLKYDPNNKFSVTAFLRDFSRNIPVSFTPASQVEPHDVAIYRRDVEESEKVYFCGWHDNTVRGEQVTDKNLHKTRRLLGEAAYIACKKKNLSSRWSDKKPRFAPVTVPA